MSGSKAVHNTRKEITRYVDLASRYIYIAQTAILLEILTVIHTQV